MPRDMADTPPRPRPPLLDLTDWLLMLLITAVAMALRFAWYSGYGLGDDILVRHAVAHYLQTGNPPGANFTYRFTWWVPTVLFAGRYGVSELAMVLPNVIADVLLFPVGALKYDDGPIAVRYPRGNAYGLDEKAPFTDVPIGTPLIVEEGEDLLILAVGHMLFHARQAAETLRGEGLKVTVADVRTVKPLEKKVYRELFSKHRAILTVEDNVLAGGYGTAVASLLSDSDSFDTPIGHVSLPDAFVTHGDIPNLFRLHEMDAEGIAKTARTVLAKIDQPSRVS
jgi:hypothetical protein